MPNARPVRPSPGFCCLSSSISAGFRSAKHNGGLQKVEQSLFMVIGDTISAHEFAPRYSSLFNQPVTIMQADSISGRWHFRVKTAASPLHDAGYRKTVATENGGGTLRAVGDGARRKCDSATPFVPQGVPHTFLGCHTRRNLHGALASAANNCFSSGSNASAIRMKPRSVGCELSTVASPSSPKRCSPSR